MEDDRSPTESDWNKAPNASCKHDVATLLAAERRATWKRAIEAAAGVAGTKWQGIGQSIEAQNIERWIRELEDPEEAESLPKHDPKKPRCAFCKQRTGRNITNTLMVCQDRDESPRSPCWRANDILLDASDGVYRYDHTDEELREAYERACFELKIHKSFSRFREPGKGWRQAGMIEKINAEWAAEKERRAKAK